MWTSIAVLYNQNELFFLSTGPTAESGDESSDEKQENTENDKEENSEEKDEEDKAEGDENGR